MYFKIFRHYRHHKLLPFNLNTVCFCLPQRDDSEDDEYALSENWTFEQSNRRWSRVGDQMAADIASSHFIAGASGGGGSSTNSDGGTTTATTATGGTKSAGSRDSSTEKLLADDLKHAQQMLLLGDRSPQHSGRVDVDLSSTAASGAADADASTLPVRFRRTGSERLKDGAKALLRRVESIKSRRRKRQNRDGMCCELPAELDLSDLQSGGGSDARITMARSQPPSPLPGSPLRLQPVDFGGQPHRLSPLNYSTLGVGGGRQSSTLQPQSLSNRTSPLHFFHHHHHQLQHGLMLAGGASADESSSYYSDASQESSSANAATAAAAGQPKKRPSRTRRFLLKGGGGRVEDGGVMSDSECQQRTTPLVTAIITQPSPTGEQPAASAAAVKLQRGGSLNLGKDGQKERRGGLKSRSFRSRSSCRKAGGDGGWSSSGYGEGDGDATSGGGKSSSKAVVLRWHSFQSHAQRTAAQAQKTTSMPAEFMFRKFGGGGAPTAIGATGQGVECGGMAELVVEPQRAAEGMPLAAMSCGQIQVSGRLCFGSEWLSPTCMHNV